MPQYYTGVDPANAFSNGLRTGYEFIDNIFARKRQQALDKQNADRADRQLNLQEQGQNFSQEMALRGDARAQTASDLSTDEAKQRLAVLPEQLQNDVKLGRLNLSDAEFRSSRNPTVAQQQDQTFELDKRVKEAELAFNKTKTAAAAEELARAKQMRADAAGMAKDMLTASQQPQSTAQPGTSQPQAPAQGIASQQAPTAPRTLQDIQHEVDQKPSLITQAATAVKNFRDDAMSSASADYWNSVANNKGLFSGAYDKVRRDPLSQFDNYMSARDKVKPENRALIDNSMLTAANDKLSSARADLSNTDPNDKLKMAGVTARLSAAQAQVAKIADAKIKTSAADAGIKGNVKPTDPRVVQAITSVPQASTTPVMTRDEVRAQDLQQSRVSGASKLNDAQVSRLTRMYANGQISATQLENLQRYGTLGSPNASDWKAISLGEGNALMFTSDGRSYVKSAGGNAGASAKEAGKFMDGSTELLKSYIAKNGLDLEEKAARAAITDQLAILYAQDPASVPQLMASPMGMRSIVEQAATRLSGTKDQRESAIPIENAPPAPQSGWGAPIGQAPDGSPIYDLTQ